MRLGNAMLRLAIVVAMLACVARAADIGGVEGNSLELRQFKIENARLPGSASVRQSVIAWQVIQGSWNGQVLDGLSLVCIKSTSEDGRSSSFANCYVSHEASIAQREALRTAFAATQLENTQQMRLEPAVITMELEGETVVLHIGLVG
ncbi:MAG: DUF1326 domain-containing protein [Phycisphaerales bacterium]|nr:DUF1326 domain-containing protein [Phycisphaerales bacterium]